MANEQESDLKELREQVNKLSFDLFNIGDQFKTIMEQARTVIGEVVKKSIQADASFKQRIISLFVRYNPDVAGFCDAIVIEWVKKMAEKERDSSDRSD